MVVTVVAFVVVVAGGVTLGLGTLVVTFPAVQEPVCALYISPLGHWMMYILPNKSHCINLMGSVGCG